MQYSVPPMCDFVRLITLHYFISSIIHHHKTVLLFLKETFSEWTNHCFQEKRGGHRVELKDNIVKIG